MPVERRHRNNAGCRRSLRHSLFWGVLTGYLGGCSTTVEPPPPETLTTISPRSGTWLLIDTKADTLSVMHGERPTKVFKGIAMGSSGAGIKARRGDNKTPLGTFRVGWFNDQSKFKRFIGLDYPNPEYAERALREHRIDQRTHDQIQAAWSFGQTPPQETALGGQIGIHGIGAGNPSVHQAGINWTSGCVALTNQQIDDLRPWVQKGMHVEIR